LRENDFPSERKRGLSIAGNKKKPVNFENIKYKE
jgi:hypothetical protein